MDHEEAVDLVAIYALDALPAAERDQLRSHLRSCVECCWEALLFTETAVALAKAARPAPGPPRDGSPPD